MRMNTLLRYDIVGDVMFYTTTRSPSGQIFRQWFKESTIRVRQVEGAGQFGFVRLYSPTLIQGHRHIRNLRGPDGVLVMPGDNLTIGEEFHIFSVNAMTDAWGNVMEYEYVVRRPPDNDNV